MNKSKEHAEHLHTRLESLIKILENGPNDIKIINQIMSINIYMREYNDLVKEDKACSNIFERCIDETNVMDETECKLIFDKIFEHQKELPERWQKWCNNIDSVLLYMQLSLGEWK